MERSLSILIPGQPHPKGRPRFSRRGNFVATYTDAKTLAFEKLVAAHAQRTLPIRWELISDECAVDLVFIFKRPKRLLRAKDPEGRIRHSKKPDLDNLCKSVCDGLDGVLYTDDSKITNLKATKFFAAKNEDPKTIITVRYGGSPCLSW